MKAPIYVVGSIAAVVALLAPAALAVPPGAAEAGVTCIQIVKPLTGLDDQQERMLQGRECAAPIHLDHGGPFRLTTDVNQTIRFEELRMKIYSYDAARRLPGEIVEVDCTTNEPNGCDRVLFGPVGASYYVEVIIRAYAGKWSWRFDMTETV